MTQKAENDLKKAKLIKKNSYKYLAVVLLFNIGSMMVDSGNKTKMPNWPTDYKFSIGR